MLFANAGSTGPYPDGATNSDVLSVAPLALTRPEPRLVCAPRSMRAVLNVDPPANVLPDANCTDPVPEELTMTPPGPVNTDPRLVTLLFPAPSVMPRMLEAI